MKKKKDISVFSSPEVIDGFIKSKLAIRFRGGSNTKVWDDESLAIRDSVILDYLTQNNFSRRKTAEQIMSRWGICFNTAAKWILECIRRLRETMVTEAEDLRTVYIERIEELLARTTDNMNMEASVKVLELYGKVLGFINTPKASAEVSEGSKTIKFEFS